MGYETAIALAVDEVPTSPPGERFVYSDINFFLLGDIVRRVSGMPLDRFARERIFEPLGMKDTMFNPPASLAAAHRADGELHALRLAVPGARDDDAARRRARSDGAAHGRRRRPRRPLQHGRRSGHLLPHAARRRRISGRRPHPLAARGREDDERRLAGPRDQHARARLGHRFGVLVQSRRAAADRIVRPHRLHRHVALDRSGDRHVRHLPVEPRASGRQGRRHAAPRARRDGRRGGGDEPAAGSASTQPVDRPRLRRRRAPCRPRGTRAGPDRHRRAARRRLRAAARQARRPGHQSHRASRATARRPSTCSTARRT